MLITPLQLIKEALPIDQQLPEGAIDYTDDIRQVGPLHVCGRAELLIEDRGHGEDVSDIRLRGDFHGNFEQLCARCLEPVPAEIADSFDLIFRPENVDAEPGERAITEEETEIGYYDKSGLLLEDALREQVLLTLPARALCSEGCQGISAVANSNVRTLHEAEHAQEQRDGRSADPRWSALASLNLKS